MDTPEDLAQEALQKKFVEKLERVRTRAMHAAQRLMDARDPEGPRPSNTIEFLDMIQSMLKTPKKWGVFLTEPEKKALKAWDRIARVMLARRKHLETLTERDRGEPEPEPA